MYITPDTLVKQVAKIAHPGYNGRKFKVEIANGPLNMASYWDGGSRDYWAVVKLDEMKVVEVPQQSAWDRPIDGIDRVKLPAGFVAVKHSRFCGHDMGLTFYVPAESSPMFITAPVEDVTEDQKIVLAYTRSRKSSYAGISDYRFHEATKKGITRDRWNAAKSECIARGWLNKAGAITNDGRNVIAQFDDWRWV